MHELSLAEEIADLVARKAEDADLATVSVLTLGVGTLASVEVEALSFALEAALRGGIAEGARIDIDEVAARALCPKCGREQEIAERFAACTLCGAYGLRVIGGTELRLKSIEGRPRQE